MVTTLPVIDISLTSAAVYPARWPTMRRVVASADHYSLPRGGRVKYCISYVALLILMLNRGYHEDNFVQIAHDVRHR